MKLEEFYFPIEKIRFGYLSDIYFNRTKEVLIRNKNFKTVTMQVFQKIDDVILAGVEFVKKILKIGTGCFKNMSKAKQLYEELLILEKKNNLFWNSGEIDEKNFLQLSKKIFNIRKKLHEIWIDKSKDLEVFALKDGSLINSYQTVMHIKGAYYTFAQLETLYLGVLTHCSCIATNTYRCVKEARGKPILMFGARHENIFSQPFSGWAAILGGAKGASTQAQCELCDIKPSGTMPHALIACYNGNTTLATIKFAEVFQKETNIISLVDFENNCVQTSLNVAKALKGRLYGVRLDTAENLIDKSILEDIANNEISKAKSQKFSGVSPYLVEKVRKTLDMNGFKDIKIFVSGGFNSQKIAEFEKLSVPCDGYGVGSALVDNSGGIYDFTADIVEVEGKKISKIGRSFISNPNMVKIDL